MLYGDGFQEPIDDDYGIVHEENGLEKDVSEAMGTRDDDIDAA